MNSIARDVRFALRLFSRNPGITIVVMLSLGLTIGPNVALFSFVDHIFLRPQQASGASQLLQVNFLSPRRNWIGISYPDLLDYGAAVGSSAQVFGLRGSPAIVNTPSGPKFVASAFVTENYFEALQVKPGIGRILYAADQHFTGLPPIMISYSLWQREFAADTAIVGQMVLVNTLPCAVVGIAPRGYRGPGRASLPIDLWLPASAALHWDSGAVDRSDRKFKVFVRLPDPQRKPQVEAILTGVAARIASDSPSDTLPQRANLEPEESASRGGRVMSYILLAMVGLVLLVACANIAGVLLAQGEARRGEFAIRLAVGANRRQLVRQLLTESLLLALVGAAFGLVLAGLFKSGFSILLPSLPLSIGLDTGLDVRALGYTLILTGAAALASGLTPALRVSRPDLFPVLKGDVPGAGSHTWFRGAVLIAQVAICQFLLVGAGLLARSYFELEQVQPGFDPDRGLLVAELVSPGRVDTNLLIETLQATAGIGRVAYSRSLPLSLLGGSGGMQAVTVPGSDGQRVNIGSNSVSPNYLSVMGTRLLRGRDFGSDAGGGEVVVNERMARQFWGSADLALGKLLQTDRGDLEVIGVVENGKYRDLLEEPIPYLFRTAPSTASDSMSLVIETRGDPSLASTSVRTALQAAAPDVQIYSLQSMREHMRMARLPQEMGVRGMGTLGLLGIFLAAGGLYGMMSYQVTRRQHEIGVRMALGAQPKQILIQVLRHSLALVAVGVGIGVIIAILVARVASSLLYQVSEADPWGIAAAVAVVSTVSLAAAFRPARRIVSVNPIVVLRSE